MIASFALCGFANISSIGIQLGGIGALAPERRHELARLGLRALFAGNAGELSFCLYRGDSLYDAPSLRRRRISLPEPIKRQRPSWQWLRIHRESPSYWARA